MEAVFCTKLSRAPIRFPRRNQNTPRIPLTRRAYSFTFNAATQSNRLTAR
jgi:hypothetical protein